MAAWPRWVASYGVIPQTYIRAVGPAGRAHPPVAVSYSRSGSAAVPGSRAGGAGQASMPVTLSGTLGPRERLPGFGERVIAADPQRLFDIVADPAMHPVIDGSGTVQASATAARSGTPSGGRSSELTAAASTR